MNTRLPRPPEPTGWAKHTMAISKAMRFMCEHWCSLNSMIPEEVLDGVVEKRIHRRFRRLRQEIDDYAVRLNSTMMQSHDYDEAMQESLGMVTYFPVETLTTIGELYDRIEAEKDQSIAEAARTP